MDSARNGLANFLVSKQLEADAELLELHGLTSAPPSVPGWEKVIKSLPVYDQDLTAGVCPWILFTSKQGEELVTVGIPTVSYEKKSEKEQDDCVKFVVNIEKAKKLLSLRFYCQVSAPSRLIINSMTTIQECKEQEYFPSGFVDMDEDSHTQLKTYLMNHKVDSLMARAIFQTWSHYVTSLKKDWATKFLDYIY